ASAHNGRTMQMVALKPTGSGPGTSSGSGSSSGSAGNPSTEPLVQFSNLKYLGAFRVPHFNKVPNLNYGGGALGYNPGSASPGSLFINCNTSPLIAEISIPTPVISSNIHALNTATLLQPCGDPTAGGTVGIGSGSTAIGGMLVYNGKLITTQYLYYDASASQ